MPSWVRTAVDARDGGRCMFRVEDNRVCGRRTQLYFERRHWTPDGAWDPEDYQLTCLYHLRDGVGLDLVDWRSAARA